MCASATSLDNTFGNSTAWENYVRLSMLVISGGTRVLRELFDLYVPPENLANTLSDPKIYRVLVDMKNNGLITADEWELLFPPAGLFISESWEIPLLFKLLTSVCSLQPPTTGWDNLPNSSDMSLSADLVRLKYYRNTIIAHLDPGYLDNKLTDEEFNRLWEEIKHALLRIVHVYAPRWVKPWEKAIDKLHVAAVDPDKSYSLWRALAKQVHEIGEAIDADERARARARLRARRRARRRARARIIREYELSIFGFLAAIPEILRKLTWRFRAPIATEASMAEEAAAATTTPPEILARSPEALKAYKEALIRGKTKNQRVLVTVVGPARAGKTSLLKSLKGEKFHPDEDSTEGLVLQKAFCKPQEKSWFEEDDSKDDLSKNRIVECIAQKMVNNQEREGKTLTEITGTNFQTVAELHSSQSDLENDEYEVGESVIQRSIFHEISRVPIEVQVLIVKYFNETKRNEIAQVPKEIQDLLEKRIRDTQNTDQRKNENEISLKTLDFAGQQVYEVILPSFMSSKSIYILVHSLENNLFSDARPKVKQGNTERELENPFKMTHLDTQEFWLSCISSYAKKDVDSVDIKVPVALPPVFVVCTHADVCEQDPRKVARELCKILTRPENPYSKHVVPNVYTVDNTLSGNREVKDESAKRLKMNIEDLSKLLPQVNEDIPVSWLRFEEKLSKLVEKEQKKFLDLEEARRIATKCNIDTSADSIEFTTLLNYLHDLKTIIYFEETRTVFIDTQWLVDMFVKVITVMPFEEWKEYVDYWRKLENQGILQRALVEHVWSDIARDGQNTVDSLLLIMEKFSLICPWRMDKEEVYLVPCMLCNSKESEDVEELLADKKSSTMVIRFKSFHLPMGIFPRLVVALAEHGKKEWPDLRLPKLRPNFCRMYNAGQEVQLDIGITSGIRTISVTVCNKNDIDDPSVTKFCQYARKVLDQIFVAMRKTRPRVESMEFEYGIRCPVCTKSKTKCSSHKTEGCKRDSCLHFVSEEELKLDRPECHEDDTNPDILIREDAYEHWFPKTNKLPQVQLETHDLETSDHRSEASGNAGCQELVACVGMQDLASIRSTEVAVTLAEYLQLDRLSMTDPPADIQDKCRYFCQQLKKMGRHDMIKEIRKTLPSGMTGPLLDDDTLYQELEFKTRRDLSRALCGNDLWKCLASVLGVSGDHFGYFERQQNPAMAMLEDESNRGLKIAELYDLLVRCDAAALADKYL